MNGADILEHFTQRLSQSEALLPRLHTLPRLPSPPEDLQLLTSSYQGTPAVFPAAWISDHHFSDFDLLASDWRDLLTGILQAFQKASRSTERIQSFSIWNSILCSGSRLEHGALELDIERNHFSICPQFSSHRCCAWTWLKASLFLRRSVFGRPFHDTVDAFRLHYAIEVDKPAVSDAEGLSASRCLIVETSPMMEQDLQLESGEMLPNGKNFLLPIPLTIMESMDFGAFISEFSFLLKENHNQLLYLAIRSLPKRSLPSSMPKEFCLFIDSTIFPITRLKFVDEATIKQINLWIGANVTSRIHFDALDNIHICLSGKKIVHLYSPLELPNLYPEPWDKDRLNNFSGIGSVLVANRAKHTRFFENATCFRTELNSGDAVFIPAGWWHEVFTLQPSVSVNLWFGPSLNARFRPTLMHLKSEKYLKFMLQRV